MRATQTSGRLHGGQNVNALYFHCNEHCSLKLLSPEKIKTRIKIRVGCKRHQSRIYLRSSGLKCYADSFLCWQGSLFVVIQKLLADKKNNGQKIPLYIGKVSVILIYRLEISKARCVPDPARIN